MFHTVLLCALFSQVPEPAPAPAPAAGTDTQKVAKAIISRGIQAHGGRDQLAKVRADRVKLKGTLVVGKAEVPYMAETLVQLPGQFRNAIQFNQGKKDVVMVQVINGEKTGLWINGQKQPLPPAMEEEMRQSFALNRVIRLVSLLEDPAFELAYLGKEEDPEGARYVVRVNRRGLREMRLFFDEKTGFLVKTEHPVEFQGKPYLQEERYSDFRDLSGFKRPVKMEVLRGGQKMLDVALTEVHYPEFIPPLYFDPDRKP